MANQHGDGPSERGDRTILKPRPGAGRASSSSAPQPSPPPPPQEPVLQQPAYASPAQPASHVHRIEFAVGGMDPLYHAAGPLLLLAGNLRHSTEAIDTNLLRRQLVTEVRAFEERTRAAGINAEQAGAARYALCASLDEAILATPWGAASDWGSQPLLVMFHREAWGGEKFYQLVDRTKEDPARYGGLLEVLYACLSLGFAGKYALDPQGQMHRERLQHELHERIRSVRGPVSAALSEHWQGVKDRRNPIIRYVPWWVIAAAGLAILTGAYLFYRTQLSHRAEPVLASLSQVGLESFAAPQPAAPPVLPAKTLKQLLSGLEQQRRLQVEEDGLKSTVILSASDLFASGSAQVNESYRGVLQEIGAALNEVPGQILVVGHSDDRPVRSFRYQNNYELSADRALAVVQELSGVLAEPSRMRSTGVGSSQPRYSPPDTEANRALNRRVEIVHLAPGATAQ